MSATNAELGDILERLLYDEEFRLAFTGRDPATWQDFTPGQAAALAGVDRDELRRTAARIRSSVLRGQGAGDVGLTEVYARTWQAAGEAGVSLDALTGEFLASPSFGSYRELPYAGRGICLEEAFHAFLSGHAVARDENVAAWLDHEFLVRLMSIIASLGSGAFEVRTPLARRSACAWYAVREYPAGTAVRLGLRPGPADGQVHRQLYAATPTSMVCGPCPPALESVLRLGARDACPADGPLARVADKAQSLGLIA